MIKARDITLSYGKRNIIEGASFDIERGDAAVFVGDNGSGKSTLLSAVAGTLKPKRGHIEVGARIGYVPQGSGLIEELTFSDNLRFFASLEGVAVPDTLPLGADYLRKIKIKNMSGGMKKLCSIVCAVITKPEILILDEPCASLDREHKLLLRDFLCTIKDEGVTILYVGHDSDEYECFATKYISVRDTVKVYTPDEYRAVLDDVSEGSL